MDAKDVRPAWRCSSAARWSDDPRVRRHPGAPPVLLVCDVPEPRVRHARPPRARSIPCSNPKENVELMRLLPIEEVARSLVPSPLELAFDVGNDLRPVVRAGAIAAAFHELLRQLGVVEDARRRLPPGPSRRPARPAGRRRPATSGIAPAGRGDNRRADVEGLEYRDAEALEARPGTGARGRRGGPPRARGVRGSRASARAARGPAHGSARRRPPTPFPPRP